jgi:hypothetical protein
MFFIQMKELLIVNRYLSTLEEFYEAERRVREARAALEQEEATRSAAEKRLPALWVVQGYKGAAPLLGDGIHFVSDGVQGCVDYCADKGYFIEKARITEKWEWIPITMNDELGLEIGVVRMIRPFNQLWRIAQKWLDNH